MSYLGNPIVSTDFPVDTFSGNGSTTAFTLTQAPASVNAVIVAVSGVLQEPSTYSVSGTTLTFTAAPPSGTSNISVRHLGVAGIPNTPAAGSVQYSSLNSSLQGTLVGRNRIINGAMVIDQRNSGASVTASTTAAGIYTVDRFFYLVSQASKFTLQQNAGSVTPPAGFSNYLGLTSSSAYSAVSSDYFWIEQPIEGFNTADLNFGTANAKTVTLSFWVRSSLTGNWSGSLCNGVQDRSYPFTFNVASANTWTNVSVTIAGDTTGTWVGATNGTGLRVRFDMGSGSTYRGTAGAWVGSQILGVTSANSVVGTNGATFYITGVQLEVGSTATSFDYRPYGTELALCQRYFQKYTQPALRGAMNSASGAGRFGMVLPVVMRATPTSTVGALPLYDGFGTGTVSGIGVDYSTTTTAEYDLTSTTNWSLAGRVGIVYQNGSTSLTLSAEL